MRDWIEKFENDLKSGYSDWIAYCKNPAGCEIRTTFKDEDVVLPEMLEEARNKLISYVPDEENIDANTKTFNGLKYCLTSIKKDLRLPGEVVGCELEFCKSDYRAFLVTNGLEKKWAERCGLDHEFQNPYQWAKKWTKLQDTDFYENSFGINVLVSILDKGKRLAVFRERGGRIAVNFGQIVGTADEGIRRMSIDRLMDEKSYKDQAPDFEKAFYRGVLEETGLTKKDIGNAKPTLLSVGRAIRSWQSAALYYLPLNMTRERFEFFLEGASDGDYEFVKSGLHYVELNEEAIRDFVLKNEERAPVAGWVVAMGLYSARSDECPKVFISYSHKDQRLVKSLANYLRSKEIKVWLDDVDLRVGQNLFEAITNAIEEVDYVIAVISSNSIESGWVDYELDQAMRKKIEDKNIKILPILKDNVKIPKKIGTLKFADFRTQLSRKKYKEHIAESILKGI